MSITALLFGVWAVFLAWFGFSMTRQELTTSAPEMATGDTSLGPRSVNWLVTFAFVGALVICMLT